MKPKLKLNHIKDLHDARYCAAIGVHLLSFRLEDSAEHAIAPKSVAGIMGWLSGPIGVGEFDDSDGAAINEIVTATQLTWISLPFDYPVAEAAEIKAHLIFRGPEAELNLSGLGRMQTLAERFPEALFEFSAGPDTPTWEALKAEGLMARSILRFSEPTPIYALLEREGHPPHAFSLGAFVEEPDGALDYETCDEFFAQYEALSPA
ncbi:MAG: hypothetical protein AAGN35_06160 [Bacteroidota bacterium]